jgi:hypothetical protein
MTAIERAMAALQQLVAQMSEGSFDRPVHYSRPTGSE